MKSKTFVTLFVGIILAASISTKAQLIEDLVLAEVTASRDKVYLNEQFLLIISLTYTGVSLDQNFQLSSMPDRNKLICSDFKELPPERNLQGNQIREKRRFACEARAVSAEILEIAPILRVALLSGFGPFRQISPHNIKAKSLSLPVLPLPDTGKPAAFSGAVGQFLMDVEVSPSDVAVGDLITTTTKIHGKGYLEPVSTINIPPAANFKAYPSKMVPCIEQGMRTFEQIFVPQSTNAVTIPSVTFCFFDPYDSTYKTLLKGPFPVTFHPQKKVPVEAIYHPSEKKKSSTSLISPNIFQKRLNPGVPSFSRKMTMITGYWVVITVLSLWVTVKYNRGSIFTVGILIIALITFLPLWNFLQNSMNEASVIRNEKARLAPAYSAVISFEIPRDSLVRVVETYGTWSKIVTGDRKGWIPADSLTNTVSIK